jgi:hypothetical protein
MQASEPEAVLEMVQDDGELRTTIFPDKGANHALL